MRNKFSHDGHPHSSHLLFPTSYRDMKRCVCHTNQFSSRTRLRTRESIVFDIHCVILSSLRKQGQQQQSTQGIQLKKGRDTLDHRHRRIVQASTYMKRWYLSLLTRCWIALSITSSYRRTQALERVFSPRVSQNQHCALCTMHYALNTMRRSKRQMKMHFTRVPRISQKQKHQIMICLI